MPGAKDVAVEFTSLSKTYSMAGWRIGFAVGNAKLIAAMTRVKSYLDYGAFTPIQAAACAALNGPQDIVEKNRALYHKRRDVLVESFGRAGWDIPAARASMFAWAPLPPALAHLGSLEFSKQLLTQAKVAVAPGVGYGENGEGYRPHRAGRERAAPAPGGAQREALSPVDGRQHARRRRRVRGMSRPGFAFSTRLKVRYAEIDGQKVVFNSRYLEYADVALTEYLGSGRDGRAARRRGAGKATSAAPRSIISNPFVLGDSIDVWVRIEAVGNSSYTQRFEMTHAETGELHAVVDDGGGRGRPGDGQVAAARRMRDSERCSPVVGEAFLLASRRCRIACSYSAARSACGSSSPQSTSSGSAQSRSLLLSTRPSCAQHLDRRDRAHVAAVDQDRGGGHAGLPALAPLPQRDHRRQQREALVGQPIFDLAAVVGQRLALEDAVLDQPREPVGQDVARDARARTGIPRNDAGR